jgi:hypothetical protein
VSKPGGIETLRRGEVSNAGKDKPLSRFDDGRIRVSDHRVSAEITERLEHGR